MHTVYLSLGSNLGNPRENLDKAIEILAQRAGKVISRSAFYETEPWGFESQHRFVNNCIAIETTLSPIELLDLTQEVERELGRLTKSNGSYADRMIDIDLLLFDDRVIVQERLTLPHPLMHQRAFVMDPLCEIAPEMVHPVILKKIAEITKLLER